MCVLYIHTHTVTDLCASGDHDCEQVCISTPGSYKCACKDGFTLMDNGRTCSGECVWTQAFVLKAFKDVCCGLCNVTLCVLCVMSPACSNAATDVVFLIDGSKSVRPENFELIKKWIIQIIERLDVSEKNVHVGLVQYSSSVNEVRACASPTENDMRVSHFLNNLFLYSIRSFPWAATTTRKT